MYDELSPHVVEDNFYPPRVGALCCLVHLQQVKACTTFGFHKTLEGIPPEGGEDIKSRENDI